MITYSPAHTVKSTKYRFEHLLKYFDKSSITYHPTVGREYDSLDLYYGGLLRVGVIAYDGDRIILKLLTHFILNAGNRKLLPRYIEDSKAYRNRFILKPIIIVPDTNNDFISTIYEFQGVREECKERIEYYLNNPEEYWKKVREEAERTGVYREDII